MKANGVSIKGIVRRLGLSRNTVKKYLRSSSPPSFKVRDYMKMACQFKVEISEMLKKKYIGTRIYAELLRLGYTGSLPTIHRFVRTMRVEEEINKNRTTRIETPAGQQMQYDWKVWDLTVGGKKIKIYLHQIILSYSRKKYYTCSISINTRDIVRAIVQAMEFFGGMARELVIDNPKQLVITHHKDGVIRFNDEFLKFCGLYGIEPNPCQNYRARTKGKVERPFYYLQEHYLRGLEVKELAEFDHGLREFNEAENQRMHTGLNEIPEQRFLEEKKHLVPLPKIEPTMLYSPDIHKVSNDGYISYNGNFYPVPMRLCLRTVMIEPLFGKAIRVYDQEGQLVVEQDLNITDKRIRPLHPEHEQMNKQYQENKATKKSAIVTKFRETFPEKGNEYIEGLKGQVGCNLYWHLSEIISYTQIYSLGEVSRVIGECLQIGAYHKNSVCRLLGRYPIKNICPNVFTGDSLALPASININRPLSEYRVEDAGHE